VGLHRSIQDACRGDRALAEYAPDSDEAPSALPRCSPAPTPAGRSVRGLGKMGAGIARNAIDHGWHVSDSPHERHRGGHGSRGSGPAPTLEDLVAKLEPPRTVWLMSRRQPVDEMLFGVDECGGALQTCSLRAMSSSMRQLVLQDALERSSRLAERASASST